MHLCDGQLQRLGEELMALSVFALADGVVYHTYSCYDRGTDAPNTTWGLLDRTPKGRDAGAVPGWPRRHDEYTGGSDAGSPVGCRRRDQNGALRRTRTRTASCAFEACSMPRDTCSRGPMA